MKKELLSLTDENSILITAEFLESARRLAYGGVETCRFELDLIVNKYITCRQLLEAIEKGLESALREQGVDPQSNEYTKKLKSIYMDDTLASEHPMLKEPSRAKRKAEKKIKSLEDRSDAIDDEYPSEEGTDECRLDDTLTGYLICWKVFQDCKEAYEKNYNGLADNAEELENCDRELIRTDYIRSHPVIGRGSINFNTLDRDEVLSISSRPQCWLFHDRDSDRTLKDLGFITTTRLVFDPILWHHSTPLFDERENNPVITEAFHGKTPEYNISDRPLKKLEDEPIKIIEPSTPPQRPHQSIVSLILPTLLSTGTMVGIRLMTAGSSGNMSSLVWMSGAMGVTSVIIGIVNRIIQNVEHTKNTNEWKKQYQDYVDRLLETIVNRQHKDVELLHKFYPPAMLTPEETRKGETSLVSKILSVSGDIYSRGQNHPDFLSVRLGVSTQDSHLVPSVFEITGDKKEAVFASVRYRNILHKGTTFRILQNGDVGLLTPSDGSEGYLIDLPADIAAHYGYLHGAPVQVNLEQCGALGVIYGNSKENCQPFLDNVLLDLCFHHSPEDVQCVMFCEKTDDWRKQQTTIRRYKHLPHFHELLGDMAAFVFTETDAHRVFNKLTEILSERKDYSEDTRVPHIVVIFQEEYSLKKHLFSQYLPDYAQNGCAKTEGISFVFCTEYPEQLPKYCGQVIDMRKKEEHLLLPHTLLIDSIERDRNSRQIQPTVDERVNVPLHREYYSYTPDLMIQQPQHLADKEMDDEFHRAFKVLSALHYERIAQGADMPSSVTFFDMVRQAAGCEAVGNPEEKPDQAKAEDGAKKKFLKPVLPEESKEPLDAEQEGEKGPHDAVLGKIRADLKKYVLSEWGLETLFEGDSVSRPSRDVIKSLAVPIGKNTQGIVELDLHEKGDGPHMLVAGTTGSGKTETILSYLINLCTLYTPEQINLLLMDMKGEDFVKRIGSLPHVVGTVTDVDGDKTGTNTAYMLKRFLLSMNAEVKRRKLMLSKMGVNNISNYIEARNNLDRHMHNQHIPESRRQELEQMEPMPHLFLVIDEFTELMQFSSENGGVDFKTAITSLARVGRSLGFHIILISQNIENAITSDIRVNSRARLCLKVATREASKEMIGSDLAASPLMPGNGRAYLLVGTGSRFEYFQSAFSGADALGAREEPVVVTLATPTGEYRVFYSSEKHGTVERPTSVLDGKESEQGLETPEAKSPVSAQNNKTEQSGVTQIKLLSEVISQDVWKSEKCANISTPHKVFQQPMPSHCWFNFDWEHGAGHFEVIKQDDLLKE
jgi:S-DNA-T family DNA segregation ATPase FtsK/SpoIIIE